jgi:transcriptional regulator with XRE-family HTH domain
LGRQPALTNPLVAAWPSWLRRPRLSHHTLAGLREGKRVADRSLMKFFRAAEALWQEADPVVAAMDKTLSELRRLLGRVGGRNKLAKLLGVTGPYLGRVLRGEKPMTEELVERLAQSRDNL